jgi:hypothetical protein
LIRTESIKNGEDKFATKMGFKTFFKVPQNIVQNRQIKPSDMFKKQKKLHQRP